MVDSIGSITPKLEFEFVPGSGSWTDMAAYVDEDSRLSFNRGVGADRKMRASGMSFTLDNASEDLTIGNSSSTYFNKIKKGIGVRFSWTSGGTPKYEFRGYIASIVPVFAHYGQAGNRVAFTCEGQTSFLRKYTKYGMALQTGVDVDDALTAIMTAVGQSASLYSFADSSLVIPYVFPRGDALTDLVAVAQSDPGMLLFEDGQGRLRLASVVGGNHASPTYSWGGSSQPQPEGDVSPDYQNDSHIARASVEVGSFRPTSEDVVLYRHPLNWESRFVESLSGYSKRRIVGEFDVMPVSVATKFVQTVVNFQPTADSLGASMTSSQTTMYTSSPTIAPKTFRAGDALLVEQEEMLVVSAQSGAYYQQILVVERGKNGTTAVAHVPAPPTGTPLYRKGITFDYGQFNPPTTATLTTSITATGTTIGVSNAGGMVQVGDYFGIDNEIMKVTNIGSAPNYIVERGAWNTAMVNHSRPANVYKVTINSPQPTTVGQSYVLGSEYSGGLPSTSPDIVGNPAFTNGDHIQVTGNKFIAELYNNSSAARYLSDLVIGGKALKENGTGATFAMEKAVPGILGIPEAGSVPVPYGFSSIYPAKAYVLNLLRAGRVPTPWLVLPFTVNFSVNTADMLTAEIGALVRYTGTGQYREKVDEWFRIVGIRGDLLPDDILRLTITLAPSHLWRDPQMGWYTDFNWGVAQGVLSLGEFDVSPPGVWSNVGNWTRVLKSGKYEATATVAAPSPAAVDVGNADQFVGAHVAFNSSPCTYPANTGGVGVMFRGNSSTPTAYWEARVNPSQNLIYLWNTTDGTVASVAWTSGATSSPEIEVRAQGTRIRVFVDCAAEPVLDITSTRFQTQRYAGPAFEVTSLAGSPVQPTLKDWWAHGA